MHSSPNPFWGCRQRSISSNVFTQTDIYDLSVVLRPENTFQANRYFQESLPGLPRRHFLNKFTKSLSKGVVQGRYLRTFPETQQPSKLVKNPQKRKPRRRLKNLRQNGKVVPKKARFLR